MNEVVWLHEQRRFAWLKQRNAYFSLVTYTDSGIEFEVAVLNDDYDYWEERAIDYDTDGG